MSVRSWMPRAQYIFQFIVGVALVLTACVSSPTIFAGDKKDKEKQEENEKRKDVRTIGDVVAVDGLQSYMVEGVGLIVDLDNTGSDPTPGPERSALLLEMQKRIRNRGIAGPEEILRSPKTALVRLRARIPPGVRSCKSAGCWCVHDKGKKTETASPLRPHRGDTFDVEVEVPPRDTTTSLQGGWLLESWLYEVAHLPGAGDMAGHVRARASGPVLVSAGVDTKEPQPSDLRRGRVLGGAIAREDRDLMLVTSSERTARWTIQIASRINDRYPLKNREGKPIAEAKNGQQIHLRIPPRYRHNVARYLEVLRFMPILQSGSEEADRMQVYEEELMDPATARVSALRLEGIGNRAIASLKKGLDSPDADVRFFAAESLAYLDEPKAALVLADVAREIPEYRAHALAALSSLDEPISRIKLHNLLERSDSAELLYGAFRALRELDPEDSTIHGEVIGDQLHMHVVASHGEPVIHISSRERAEVVVFGKKAMLKTPLMLKAGSSILISANEGSDQVQLTRFEVGREPQRRVCSLELRDVIRNVIEMKGTYPDVVAALVQADENRNLPGRLAIDASPDPRLLVARLQRIAEGQEKAAESPSMPNLFEWLDSKKPGDKSPKNRDGEMAEADSGAEPTYLSKPSFWDRIFRRSAN